MNPLPHKKKQRVHVLVPVYNEVHVLPELHHRLQAALHDIPEEWCISYIDDGSFDGTHNLILQYCEADSRVSLIALSRNFGLQAAISAGMSLANGNVVVLLDGDLEDPPELIPQLLDKWRQGYGVVYAQRKSRKAHFIKRFLFSSFHKIFRAMSNIYIPENAGNFSAMDQSVVEIIRKIPERNRYISGLRAYVGGKQTAVIYDREPRYAGRPKQSLLRLFRLAVDAIFGYSTMPLRCITFFGLFSASFSFLIMVNVLYKKLVSGEAILGWASVMTSILFFGGTQLIAIGIIGEYIARISDDARGRPPFVISKTLNL